MLVWSGRVGSVLKGSEQFGTIEPRCWTEWIGYLWPALLFDRLTVMIIYQCNAVPLFYWRCKSPLVLGESPEWSNNTQPHNIPFLDQTLERRPAFGCCIVTKWNVVSHHYTVCQLFNLTQNGAMQFKLTHHTWIFSDDPHMILLRLCKNFRLPRC